MQGVGGDAAEISALILDLAQSLKADGERDSAAGSLKAIHAQLDQLLQQLPDSFFESLISKDSLSSEQVGLAAQAGSTKAIPEPSIQFTLMAGRLIGRYNTGAGTLCLAASRKTSCSQAPALTSGQRLLRWEPPQTPFFVSGQTGQLLARIPAEKNCRRRLMFACRLQLSCKKRDVKGISSLHVIKKRSSTEQHQ